MPLDAVIFDLDGTLVDTTAQHARAWARVFSDFGFAVGTDRIALEIGKGGDMLVPALIGEDAERRHGEAMRKQHEEAFQQIIENEPVRAFPGVLELFEAIHARGLQIAIATAAVRDNLEKTLEQAGLDLLDYADAVITDSDVEQSKPHPGAVRPAAEKMGLSPAQCVMIGDTAYDAEACRLAGLVCLGVATGPHDAARMRRAGARAVFDSLEALHADLDAALQLAAPATFRLDGAALQKLMHVALAEAETGLQDGEIPIGSALVAGDGTVLSRGHNSARQKALPIAHAEMQAMEAAAGRLPRAARDLLLVTTLEPCAMCLGAALALGVDTIIYAHESPANGGISRMEPPEDRFLPRFVGGIERSASRDLLRQWAGLHPDDGFVRHLLRRTSDQGNA